MTGEEFKENFTVLEYGGWSASVWSAAIDLERDVIDLERGVIYLECGVIYLECGGLTPLLIRHERLREKVDIDIEIDADRCRYRLIVKSILINECLISRAMIKSGVKPPHSR